jgi:hypothetical protein
MIVLKLLENLLFGVAKRLFMFSTFLQYFRIGKSHKYPTCCVLHFSWDACQRKPAAIKRGTIQRPGNDSVYVPCAFHKRVHPYAKPYFDKHPLQLKLFKDSPREAHDCQRRRR